ncbi:MAG: hypothetical protein AAGB12_05625 [Pseudomonadota bacterium]
MFKMQILLSNKNIYLDRLVITVSQGSNSCYQMVCSLKSCQLIIGLLIGHWSTLCWSEEIFEFEPYDWSDTIYDNERIGIQEELFINHYERIKSRLMDHKEYKIRTYGGSDAAKKMVQLAAKGTWKHYKHSVTEYFIRSEDEDAIDSLYPNYHAPLKPQQKFYANFILSNKDIKYRVKMSSRKVIFSLSYDF